jgi:hypothetical protein
VKITHDNSRDQVTGDYKKDVDANEAARKNGRACVEQQHKQYRHCSQAIDVKPVLLSASTYCIRVAQVLLIGEWREILRSVFIRLFFQLLLCGYLHTTSASAESRFS